MADEPKVYCPLCGNLVPPGVTKCPVCATELQKVKARKAPQGIGGPDAADDYLRREIPKVELPKTKLTCPLCAVELKGGEKKCPRCGIPLALEHEMLECPECGMLAPAESKACPKCGVGFEEGPEIPPPPVPKEVPPPPIPIVLPVKEPVPQPEVTTPLPVRPPPAEEGLVNGRGAVNGTGLGGARGAVTGTGLVNGTGITIGPPTEERAAGVTRRRIMSVRRWQFLAVLVAVAIVIPTFIYLSYSREQAPITVDGDFGEWASIQKFGMYSLAGSAPINVDEWAVTVEGTDVFLYVDVQATIMGTTNVNSFYLFIDNDDSVSTGYVVSGIGADYLIELDGWNRSVRSSSVFEYGSATDHYDWNSWENIGSASATVSGTQLEASARLPVDLGSDARFMLISKDSFDRNGLTYPVPRTGGLLIVEQEPGPAVQGGGLVAASSSVALLRLTLSCEGDGGLVQNIVPTVSGATPAFTFQEISLSTDQERIVDITVDTSSSGSESLVQAFVAASGVTSTFAGVKVVGEPAKAYVSAAPATVQIDGAFADWVGRTSPDADSFSVGNENVDIDSVGAVNSTESSSFYVSVFGDMIGGSYVPIIVAKPSGGGGGIIIPTKKTGEDVLRVYIDSDLSAVTGYVKVAASKVIGADYMVEVMGLDGDIKSRAMYSYYAGQWSAVSGVSILAENDRQQMELGVPSSSISGSASIDFIVETTDWRSRSDAATSVPLPARSAADTFAMPPGIESWIIDGSTTSASATSMSYQRKLFYDGTNFWSFYWDGSNTVYRYSTDGGSTWSSTSITFITAGVNEASIWYDSANNIVYAIGDRSVASRNVYLQRGTVDPATHTITWSVSDRTLTASSNSLGGKNAFISKDDSGYLWIIASNLTSTIPPRYDLSTFRSGAVDSVASWIYRGNMLDADDAQPTLKGTVLPAGSGSDMWAVYGYAGNVGARKYTGTWTAQTTIYTIGSGNPSNTDNAPPCAVVDGSGVVHVVYGNGHEQPVGTSKPFIYYVYNSGGSWSVPYRLDAASNSDGNLYPTLSLDSSTGNLYSFWVFTDNNGIGITVQGKRNVSGTWSWLTFSPQTADQKQYLTSIYSVPAAQFVCWQWTMNNTAPIQVIFDKIPEFQDLALPVFFSLAICIAVMRRTRARKE